MPAAHGDMQFVTELSGANANEQSSGGALPPQSSSQRLDYRKYTVVDSGIDDEGNHWCARKYHGPGSTPEMTGYHHSYPDGAYAYSHPDGTNYYNDGQGGSRYTRKDGSGWDKKEFAAPHNDYGTSSATGEESLSTKFDFALNKSDNSNIGTTFGGDDVFFKVDGDEVPGSADMAPHATQESFEVNDGA